MSMFKIAKFLKVNGSLYGAQQEEDRYFVLPEECKRGHLKMWGEIAATVFDSRDMEWKNG